MKLSQEKISIFLSFDFAHFYTTGTPKGAGMDWCWKGWTVSVSLWPGFWYLGVASWHSTFRRAWQEGCSLYAKEDPSASMEYSQVASSSKALTILGYWQHKASERGGVTVCRWGKWGPETELPCCSGGAGLMRSQQLIADSALIPMSATEQYTSFAQSWLFIVT